MSWIKEIGPDEAEGELLHQYQELERQRGKVANILKVHSLRPSSLQAHLALYMGFSRHTCKNGVSGF